jgi:hypothetical protein
VHRDPFENIYCVIRGYKDFILHPPTDLPWLPYATLPAARYLSTKGSQMTPKFEIVPLNPHSDNGTVMCKGKSENHEENHEQCCDDTNLSELSVENHAEEAVTPADQINPKDSVQFESFDEVKSSYVPWICIDPDKPDHKAYPLYSNATQVRVRVHEGEVLFLPAHWFHHVKQSHACIAVNFWYDVRFDHRYAYQAFITSLLQNSGLDTGCPPLC